MIKRIPEADWKSLVPYLMQDPLRNYFNLLGICSTKQVHESIFGQYDDGALTGLLFKRFTGTLKFYAADNFDSDEMVEFLRKLDFMSLISPYSCCSLLDKKNLFKSRKEGSKLAVLNKQLFNTEELNGFDIRELTEAHLEEITGIYAKVFKSFASKDAMRERLVTGRGRAFGLYFKGELASVAQTDFEMKDKALIVGVATEPQYQRNGYGTGLVSYVIDILLTEGKTPMLEYEDPIAGNVYEKLGFEVIDSTWHYQKTT